MSFFLTFVRRAPKMSFYRSDVFSDFALNSTIYRRSKKSTANNSSAVIYQMFQKRQAIQKLNNAETADKQTFLIYKYKKKQVL
jgi:hypothetical protein